MSLAEIVEAPSPALHRTPDSPELAALNATLDSLVARDLYRETPLIHSRALSAFAGRHVLVKLDCLQPTGSFKCRGMALEMHRCVASGVRRFVASSAGNAGLAVAYIADRLGAHACIVVPNGTPELIQAKIRAERADVRQHGHDWTACDQLARQLEREEGYHYVSPFEGQDKWDGHSSLVRELATDRRLRDVQPAAIICSVGGGGLLNGIAEGLHRFADWSTVPIVACETDGSRCLANSMSAGSVVALPAITTIARSLGALRCSERTMKWTTEHPVKSAVLSDKQTLAATKQFLADERMLVEPACGCALAAVYEKHDTLMSILATTDPARPVVVVACGGAVVSFELLAQWQAAVDAQQP